MRVRKTLLTLTASLAFVGAVAAGCGGSSTSGTTPDAGDDGNTMTDSAPQDTGADVVDAAPPCVEGPRIDLIAGAVDAAAYDGGRPDCLACINTSCSAQLKGCADDCGCNNAILTCLGDTTQCATVGNGLTGDSARAASTLNKCVAMNCLSACLGGRGRDGGGDSSADGSGDGSSDAAEGG